MKRIHPTLKWGLMLCFATDGLLGGGVVLFGLVKAIDGFIWYVTLLLYFA